MEPSSIVIGGPEVVYRATVGATFPALTDDDAAIIAAGWSKLGVNGNKSYGEDGVTVRHPQSVNRIRPAGSTGPIKAARTEEDFERWFTMPNIDTSLWRVAWDGDEVVGSVMTFIWSDENEQLGLNRAWLEHISVRRAWRKRGVAKALIADTLRMLRDAGFTDAALGVDAKNPTGALQLYESLGFRQLKTGIGFRKAI